MGNMKISLLSLIRFYKSLGHAVISYGRIYKKPFLLLRDFGGCQDSCRLFSLCRFGTEVLLGGSFSFRVEPNSFSWLPVP